MFIIAYPETLIQYETLDEASAKAKGLSEERRMTIEVLGVLPIEVWEPPESDDSDDPDDGERVAGNA